MKTDSQRLSQNMICAGLGRLGRQQHCDTGTSGSGSLRQAECSSPWPAPRALPDPQLVSQGCCSLFSCPCSLPGWWGMLRTWLGTALFRSSSFLSTAAVPFLFPRPALRNTTLWSSLHFCWLQAGPAAEPPSQTADKTTRKVEGAEKRTPYSIPA